VAAIYINNMAASKNAQRPEEQ